MEPDQVVRGNSTWGAGEEIRKWRRAMQYVLARCTRSRENEGRRRARALFLEFLNERGGSESPNDETLHSRGFANAWQRVCRELRALGFFSFAARVGCLICGGFGCSLRFLFQRGFSLQVIDLWWPLLCFGVLNEVRAFTYWSYNNEIDGFY